MHIVEGTNLLKQPTFLNDICHGLHLDTLYFIDIFKGIQLAGLLMLYDADLVTKSL
jgi:hypothetical protein